MNRLTAAVGRLTAPFGGSRRDIHATAVRPSAATHFDGRRFHNIEAEPAMSPGTALSVLAAFASRGRQGNPSIAVPLEQPQLPQQAAELALTWLGHATVLVEIDGQRILTDPIFSDRASPSTLVGPHRLHDAPLKVSELPELDAVLISHDHYDHLDQATVVALTAGSNAPFLVPLGVGAHLRAWGVPADRVVELDWAADHHLGALTITCTEARHFSGRGLTRNNTLWCSWSIVGPTRRVFFGGDTGYSSAFGDIGNRYGPFDVTMLPIGSYYSAWPDIHVTPEQALQAHHDLRGTTLLPIHWATFNLAMHPWSEPIERLLAAADDHVITVPEPGRRVLPGEPPLLQPWWLGSSSTAGTRR